MSSEIVGGTLVSTRDRSLAVPSKNYRHSVNLLVANDASTRLVLAVRIEMYFRETVPTETHRHHRRAPHTLS